MESEIVKLRREFGDPHQLITTTDGKTLFLRAWEAVGAKETAVLIFHGITAHSGPYSMIGNPLSKEGFPTFGLDLRGHGISDGNRGDCPNLERFALDLKEVIEDLKSKYGKVVLLGHSLGVLSSIIAINTCPESIDGAILLSGAREIRPGVIPSLSIAKKLKILFSSILFPSKQVIEYYREGMTGLDDPLFNFRYTLRFMRIAKLREMAFPEGLDIPILMAVGDSDELFTVDSVRELFDDIPCNNKEFQVISGARHAVFPEGSWTYLVEWMKKNFD